MKYSLPFSGFRPMHSCRALVDPGNFCESTCRIPKVSLMQAVCFARHARVTLPIISPVSYAPWATTTGSHEFSLLKPCDVRRSVNLLLFAWCLYFFTTPWLSELRDALWGRDRKSLDAIIVRHWTNTSKPRSSELEDVLGGRDRARLEICTWR
jgi:hypothetical protein